MTARETLTDPLDIALNFLVDEGLEVDDSPEAKDYADFVARDVKADAHEAILVRIFTERRPKGRQNSCRPRHADLRPPLTESEKALLRSDCALFLAEHAGVTSARVDVVGIRYSRGSTHELYSIIYLPDVMHF